MGFSPPSGGGGAVSSVFGRTGAVVATAGDYTAAMVTNAADKSSASTQAFTATVTSNGNFAGQRMISNFLSSASPLGATGAFLGRFDGGPNALPLNRTFNPGDWFIDYTTPGIWSTSNGGVAPTDWINLIHGIASKIFLSESLN